MSLDESERRRFEEDETFNLELARLRTEHAEMLALLREINHHNVACIIEIIDEDLPRRLTALLARIDGG